MNAVLLIVPTRSRPESSISFYNAFIQNSKITDLVFALDDDDEQNYPRLDKALYEINPRGRVGMNDKLNLVATKYANQYKYIAFLGDDHRIITNGWDKKLVESISNIKNGIAYGNDLYQKENLPTAVLMDTNIIKTLGYMTPPEQQHLYLDNFWKDIGNKLGTLRYCPDVIIEHLHFSVGKSEEDSQYREINSIEMYEKDKASYDRYLDLQLNNDIIKLNKSIKG
jgi:hypothetical protein